MRHRVRACVLMGAAICLLAALSAPIGLAQTSESEDLAFSLVAQTPWNTPKQDRLEVKVEAVNEGDATMDELALRATLFGAMPSRGAYVQSLTDDPPVEVLRTYPDIAVEALDAGDVREIRFDAPVAFLAEGAQEGRIYPLKLELLQAGTPVATLRTPLIFVTAPPKQPLDLGWTFVLSAPPLMEPDGTLVGRDLERRIAPGGPLDAEVSALLALVRSPEPARLDVAVAPALLEMLVRMQDGYRVRTGGGIVTVSAEGSGATQAAQMLSSMRELAQAPNVQLSALPFASPSIPRMLASDLGKDLPAQLALGRQVVTTTLGTAPDPEILYPPGSAIDEKTLSRVRAQGVRFLPLDAGIVEQPEQPKAFAAPATATLGAGGGGAFVTAIVPDPGTQALFAAAGDDPRLAAQMVLADTAAIWLEEPDRPRGLALIAGQEVEAPASFFTALTRNVGEAPWLAPTTITNLAERHADAAPSDTSGGGDRAQVNASRPGPFPADYLANLEAARGSIGKLRSMLVDPNGTPLLEQLTRDLLFSESNALVNSGIGTTWIASIDRRTGEVFAGVRAEAAQIFTLTSNVGAIPVRLTNDTGLALRVVVRLGSQRLRFLDANPKPVTLSDQPVVLEFRAQARATGRFPVQVTVESPDGRAVSAEQIVVRSTAYSRLALLITAGAVLVLALLWVRRLLAMRKQRREAPEESSDA